MVTLSEFIFLHVITHIYTLLLIRSLQITYKTFVLNLCALYFLGCCFILSVRIVWNIVKVIKNKE